MQNDILMHRDGSKGFKHLVLIHLNMQGAWKWE